MVGSVHAHEEAKIRILNASHSCIAWAGTLRGLSYIHEGVAVPAIREMAWDYVTDDVIPCLDRPTHPAPIDLAAYRDSVLDRFGNSFVRDTNQRVAMDGFSKIPGFIAPTLRERIARGESIAGTAMLPALFLAFLARWHRGELPYAYQDGAWTRRRRMPSSRTGSAARLLSAIRCSGPLAGHPALGAFARSTAGCRPSSRSEMADDCRTHALITGAGGGIGLAVTRPTCRRGALQRSTSPPSRRRLAALIEAHPTGCTTCAPTSEQRQLAAMVGGGTRALRHRHGALQQRRGVRPGAAARIGRSELPAHLRRQRQGNVLHDAGGARADGRGGRAAA